MSELLDYRVGVLCGGTGSEREVSLVSGKAVAEAARSMNFKVDLFELETDSLPEELDPKMHLVLPLVHGAYGEDGRLSADLDAGGFAYGGCQQEASYTCFDKLKTKEIAKDCKLPVAWDLPVDGSDPLPFEAIDQAIGLPFILKPNRDGSSVGLYLVETRAEYEAIKPSLRGRAYMAEAYHKGYDLTVGILSGDPLEVIGVHPEGGLYDYEHKYTTGLSQYDVPADIDDALRERLRNWSAQIFAACGCRDLARVDFIKSKDGEIIFLEVNTLPGMTATSLLPKSAQCCGISFEALVERWIQLAAGRMPGEGAR